LIVCDAARSVDAEWTRVGDCLEEGGTHVLAIMETFV